MQGNRENNQNQDQERDTDRYGVLKEWIGESRKIVFFGGAGVSTESGVPDFRSANGLYQAKQAFGRSPEEMVSYSFFRDHRETFFEYYKTYMIYPDARPNDAHKALAKLEAEGRLLAVVTQNIDGLHQMAGSGKVLELHGSVHRNRCIRCGTFHDLAYILDPVHCRDDEGAAGWTPRCRSCGGVVKPEVILYEEALDQDVLSAAVGAISEADLLLVGGTSLVVYPAAGLLQYRRKARLVLLNRTATSYDSDADLVIREPIGEVLGECVL